MRILFDECMPFPLLARLADLPHAMEHATQRGLGGRPNGTVHGHALRDYDLFVSNDRHFRSTNRYPVSDKLGIIYVRIAPCITELVEGPLRNLLVSEPESGLVGRRIVLRRHDWEYLE